MERNSMSPRDVRGDTKYAVQEVQKLSVGRKRKSVTTASVIAIKRCGCNGPVLGQIQTVPPEDWPDDHPTQNEGTRSKLWAITPRGRPQSVAFAWGMDEAAHKLRNWWAVRNVQTVMKNREPTKGLSQSRQ